MPQALTVQRGGHRGVGGPEGARTVDGGLLPAWGGDRDPEGGRGDAQVILVSRSALQLLEERPGAWRCMWSRSSRVRPPAPGVGSLGGGSAPTGPWGELSGS